MLNNEDFKNILALISKAQIVGQDATVVAILQQKIANLMNPPKINSNEKPEKEINTPRK